MDIASWKPHGFISHPGLETLYLSARAAVLNNIVIESNEKATNDLFSYLLGKYIFADKGYTLSPQKSLVSTGDKERDFAIQCLTRDYEWQDLCLVEGKRADNDAVFDVHCLERQAMKHCIRSFEANPNVQQIYAMTLFGAKLRCWAYKPQAEAMKGLWGGDMNGTIDEYLDIGSDRDAPVIEKAFREMKSMAAEVARVSTPSSQD